MKKKNSLNRRFLKHYSRFIPYLYLDDLKIKRLKSDIIIPQKFRITLKRVVTIKSPKN